ncbi:MAG TPA: two-component regulator propeller domain-containing protein [Pirellulales bacterium]|nr:two-component regulator propeller domain-containing protein [Pirellulales bacterium]
MPTSPLRSLLIAVVVSGALAPAARALNPDRTLTQCFHRIWQVEQGLPQGSIYALRQSSTGYIYVGTQAGLVRFDGARFVAVRDRDAILADDHLWVRDLVEDANERFWIATDSDGLIALDGNVARRFTLRDGLPSDEIRCLLLDRQGTLWVGTTAGLARRDGSRFVPVEPKPGFPHAVLALCQSNDGRIWAAGDNRLMVYAQQWSAQPLKSIGAEASIEALLGAADGSVWIGGSHGLVRWADGVERIFTKSDGLAGNSIYCLGQGADGSIWAGSQEGFSRLNRGMIDNFRKRDGLSQSSVYALIEDREGSLWVGTKHGLNEFSDRRTVPYTVNEGLPSNDAGPVLQDSSGDVWIGTLNAGLARRSSRGFASLTTEDGLPSNTILALASSAQGDLWVGTDRGVCQMRKRKIVAHYTTDDGLPSEQILCLACDASGDVWAGTAAGLVRLQGRQWTRSLDEPALRDPVQALDVDARGWLTIATDRGGLLRQTEGKLTVLIPAASGARNISSFFDDPDGTLWVGTRGDGLKAFHDDKTFTYTVSDGLYDDDIFGLVGDDHDRLWMACSKGLFYVTRSDLRRYADRELERVTSTPFSPLDAQRTVECQEGVQPAVCKSNDGKVWFSTIRGVLVVDPQQLKRELPPTPVVVEEVIVNGTSRAPDQVRSIAPGQANLEFRYTALSYVALPRIAFRYKLEGFDEDWIEAGQRREAFYTNLPPGDYRFRVGATNIDQIFHEAKAPLAFSIEPRLYQRPWFLPAVATVIALAGWVGYRLRMQQIHSHLQLVVTERARIARELHDTLMQGFSGVTMQMQALAARLPESQERDTLAEIIRDAGASLRDARRSIAGLRASQSNASGLEVAIAQAARQIAEMHDVRLRLELQPVRVPLASDVEYNLFRIAQEAITNAVKHSQGRNVEVRMQVDRGALRISVADDGIGLAASAATAASTGHYGLIGMRERAMQIGATLELGPSPQGGTQVSVTLPLADRDREETSNPRSHAPAAGASATEL